MVATASKSAVHDNEKTVTRRLAPEVRKAIIVGGSLGGLFAPNLLVRNG